MRTLVMIVLSSLAWGCGGGGKTSTDLAGGNPGDLSTSSKDMTTPTDAATSAGWTFGGASGSGTFGANQPTINLATTSTIAATVTFAFTSDAGAGTVTMTDALNHAMQTTTADVTPDTLPVDNANSADGNPVLYFSFDNAGSNSILIAAASLTVTPTPSSSFAGFIGASSQCEFDTFNASTMTWTSQGASAEFTGPQTSYTIENIVPSAGAITLAPGQTIGGFLCN